MQTSRPGMGTPRWFSYSPCSEGLASTSKGNWDRQTKSRSLAGDRVTPSKLWNPVGGSSSAAMLRSPASVGPHVSHQSAIRTSDCIAGRSAGNSEDDPVLLASITGSPLSNLKREPEYSGRTGLKRRSPLFKYGIAGSLTVPSKNFSPLDF